MILIQEIRAMESKPIIRHKLVDFTSTGGFGLLSEMSISRGRVFLKKKAVHLDFLTIGPLTRNLPNSESAKENENWPTNSASL